MEANRDDQPADAVVPDPRLVEHVLRPRNLGLPESPDGYAIVRGSCGDAMEAALVVRDGRIARVGFLSHGCGMTLACGSVASTLVEGRTLVEARRNVDPLTIDASLGGLPEDHTHCARLAASAFWAAIEDAVVTAREPWKRAYRR